MDLWAVPVISGGFSLLGGVIGVLLTQRVQSHYRERHFVQEGVLARYAEFVGIASAEHQRAQQIAIIAPHVHDQTGTNQLTQVDGVRHQHRRDLQRIAWQIRLLEQNEELCRLLQRLVDEMPFEVLVFVPKSDRHARNAGVDRFREATERYGEMLARLVNLVQESHFRGRLAVPASAPVESEARGCR
jgi:hypothetical protein